MKKLLPIIMLLIGTGAGVGAGVFLRPETLHEAEAEDVKVEEKAEEDHGHAEASDLPINGREYIKLSNQFVVPMVEKDRISAMVVMTLSVETELGQGQLIYDLEPKIRDVFLRVLFDHAAVGGFRGAFLNNDNLDAVRAELKDAARAVFGHDLISDVLIFEIARQDY